jgi:hypothetical protein
MAQSDTAKGGKEMRGDEGRKLPPAAATAAAAATRSTNRTLSDMLSCDKLINRVLLYIFSPSRIDVMIYTPLQRDIRHVRIRGGICWMLMINPLTL